MNIIHKCGWSRAETVPTDSRDCRTRNQSKTLYDNLFKWNNLAPHHRKSSFNESIKTDCGDYDTSKVNYTEMFTVSLGNKLLCKTTELWQCVQFSFRTIWEWRQTHRAAFRHSVFWGKRPNSLCKDNTSV